jgi:hypothetical protein
MRRCARPVTTIGGRCCSIADTISDQVPARSKSAGRSTASPVGSTLRIRSTRNVRLPASVPAMRYHVAPFAATPSGCTTRVEVEPCRSTYSSRICTPSMTAACTASSRAGAGGRGRRPHAAGSITVEVAAASARSRSGSGSARTSLRSAARTSGDASGFGPTSANSARTSGALIPERSVRPPPARRQPPPRPRTAYTGNPATPKASRVASGRAFGHLELVGDLGGGHLPALLQEQQDRHESVGTHRSIFSRKPVTT